MNDASRRLIGALSLLLSGPALSAPVVIESIRVEGNTRVTDGTVLNGLRLQEGDRVDLQRESARLIRQLFELGLFDDVQLRFGAGELVVAVDERPVIADFAVTGNKAIPAEQLEQSLRSIGLVRGRLLNRATLEQVEREIREVYFDQGYYGLQLDTRIDEGAAGQVQVAIDIVEGAQARIRDVSIVGARAFEEALLLAQLQLHPVRYNPFSRANRYSRAALEGDSDRLRNFYLDRGYLNFRIEDTRVSLGEDERDVFISFHIDEGERFRVGEIRLGGEHELSEQHLRDELRIAPGEVFSRERLSASTRAISERLGQEGFAFARVDVDPREREGEALVDLNIVVEAGRRFYVRRVEFVGNHGNRDEVFRREMRMVEGSVFSPLLLRRSRERIQRLAFVDGVDISTERVPGAEDQLDVVVRVIEGRPGTFSASLGYGSGGPQFGLNLDLHSAFGSGENLRLAFNKTDVTDNYSISHTQPFYTTDGISRTLSAHRRSTDTESLNTTPDWVANSWGLGVAYNIPRTEYASIRLGLGYEHVDIDPTDETSDEIRQFLRDSGEEFAGVTAELAWTHDTRDRFAFPTAGAYNRVGIDGTLASADYPYFRLGYRFEGYLGLGRPDWVLGSTLRVDRGEGYGDFESLPFYERFYAGGVGSVRGFSRQSLGPRDSNDSAAGGDFRVLGSLSLFFPPPFSTRDANDTSPRRVRMGAFVDAGNVFAGRDSFDADELRLSVGVGLTWLAPVGPLKFSLARPVEEREGDQLERFQFEISF